MMPPSRVARATRRHSAAHTPDIGTDGPELTVSAGLLRLYAVLVQIAQNQFVGRCDARAPTAVRPEATPAGSRAVDEAQAIHTK
jgi:hypothetical protein